VRKDVAGYDLRGLLVGSEGTLGIVTAAWLKLVPAPEARLPVAAFHADARAGCAAIARVREAGVMPAALEYLDAGALRAAGGAFPGGAPAGAGFLVVGEADGSAAEAERVQAELVEALGDGALQVVAPRANADVDALWRWRDGVSLAVSAQRGGKVSEDIVVPVERLPEALEETSAIGARHGLEALSWGHAGDGNLHASFLFDRATEGLEHARVAAAELFALAVALGGSVSGEHGIGTVKRPYLPLQHAPPAVDLMRRVKQAFDPKGLMNPGKKV
jgi:FAD/FMN-containing dehydrogenase